MVVYDLHVVGIALSEVKADAPLVVYRDRVLSPAITVQSVQPIAGRNSQIIEVTCQVDVFQPTQGSANQIRWKPSALAGAIQVSRMVIRECLDHRGYCTASRDVRQAHHGCGTNRRHKMAVWSRASDDMNTNELHNNGMQRTGYAGR
jgi:hypothetical protein